MVMVNLPTAGVDYHVPFGGRKGSSYGPREQGRYAAGVLHHGQDRLHVRHERALRPENKGKRIDRRCAGTRIRTKPMAASTRSCARP